MILDFRSGDAALLVGDRGTEGLLLMAVLGDALGSTLVSNRAVTLLCVGDSFC